MTPEQQQGAADVLRHLANCIECGTVTEFEFEAENEITNAGFDGAVERHVHTGFRSLKVRWKEDA